MDNQIRTFFSFAFHEATSVEHAMRLLNVIDPKTEVVLIQDSSKTASIPLKKLLDQRPNRVMRLRLSGPWNKLWKAMLDVEAQQILTGKYRKAGELCFISLIPATEIHASMKRHRTVAKITNREQFWLNTLKFGEDHDDIVADTLNNEMGYMTDVLYKSLTAQQAFDLSAFEGLRFMRPVHDVQTTSVILAATKHA